MKSNSEIKDLGSLIIENPKSTLKVRDALEAGKYIFFRSGDKTKFSNSLLCTGENIFLATGGKAVVKYFSGDASYSTDTYSIHADNKNVLTKYLYYFLLLNIDQINNEMFVGAAMKHLQKDLLKGLQIHVPPVLEQQRLIRLLDKIFDDAENAKNIAAKNSQITRELFESYLSNLLSHRNEKWKERTLKDISFEFGRGKSKHRPRNDKKLYGGDYPFIQTGDVRNANHLITEYSQTYNEAGLKQSKLWPKGTICITIAANIAETGILNFDACFPDSVIGIVVNPNEADQDYVEYILQSFKAVLKAKGKGSAQDNINLATFEHQTFPFPSVTEQKIIVKKLHSLYLGTQSLERIYKQKSLSLDKLKTSVLKKVFTAGL